MDRIRLPTRHDGGRASRGGEKTFAPFGEYRDIPGDGSFWNGLDIRSFVRGKSFDGGCLVRFLWADALFKDGRLVPLVLLNGGVRLVPSRPLETSWNGRPSRGEDRSHFG